MLGENNVLVVGNLNNIASESIIYSLLENQYNIFLSSVLDDIKILKNVFKNYKNGDTISYVELIDSTKLPIFSNIIFIDVDARKILKKYKDKVTKTSSIICITEEVQILDSDLYRINHIKTKIKTSSKFSFDYKKYMFIKGEYYSLNTSLAYLLSNEMKHLNNVVIDLTYCKIQNENYTFEFDSISESYEWLTEKLSSKEEKDIKMLEFYIKDRVYNDSDKEIKYITNLIYAIQKGKKISEIFICTKEEIQYLKENYFFKMLTKQLKSNFNMYILEKDKLTIKQRNKIEYGICIYKDSVYRDYLDNEISLGFIDCKKESVNEYTKIFNDLVKISKKIEEESDLYGI